MVTLSKTQKIETLAKLLQKRYKGLSMPPERKVLEHLVFSAVLENATFEQAISAYTVLENYFIDWNEIRVSTIKELADTFPTLPDPLAAGERVRRTLQKVFEKTYMYDLDDLQKKGKNLGQMVEQLTSMKACSRFMIQYATLLAFGGHVIPLDEASFRVFRLLGMTQVTKDNTLEEVPGLERVIAKKTGTVFFTHLHQFAADYYGDPESEELRSILSSVDPGVAKRNWMPPVLVVPKTVHQKVERPTKPVTESIPFVVHDDDDIDEETAGTEAEFISDGLEYLAGESIASKSPEHKRQESSASPKAAPPKAAPPKVAPPKAAPPKAAPPKVAPPKAAPPKAAPPKATPPKAAPPKAAPLKAAPPKATPPKATPPKATPPKATPPKATPPKAEGAETAKTHPEKDAAKAKLVAPKPSTESKTTTPTDVTKAKEAKSPNRQLRAKKPK